MFEDLKAQLLNSQLERIRAVDTQPGQSEFTAEVSQRQQFLSLHSEYQQNLQQLQTSLQKQQSNNRRLNEEFMRIAAEKDFELEQLKGELEQTKKQHEIELLYCSSEIQKLKQVVMSLKGGKDVAIRERKLRSEVEALQKKVEDMQQEAEKQHRETVELRREKTDLALQLLRLKEERTNSHTNIIAERNEFQVKAESTERTARELEVRLRMTKQQLDKKQGEFDSQRLFMEAAEEKHQKRMKELSHSLQQRLHQLDSENRKLNTELAKLTAQLNCQQQLSSRYQQEIRQAKENQADRRRNTPRSDIKKPEKRHRSEDPQKQSSSKKQESTKEIKLPPPTIQRERIVSAHHCRCQHIDRCRGKLAEANEKIMQLLAEKCRMKLQLGFLRRKADSTLLLEATADLDNIYIL